MPSISEPSASTGLPDPQVATNAVGIPATPASTVNPFFSRMAIRYFVVSNSWKPSSPKLKSESTICCVNVAMEFTSATASFFNFSVRGSSFGGAGAGACGSARSPCWLCAIGAVVSSAATSTTLNPFRLYIRNPPRRLPGATTVVDLGCVPRE